MSRSGGDRKVDPMELEWENLQLKEQNRALRRFIDSLRRLLLAGAEPTACDHVLELMRQLLRDCMDILQTKDGSVLIRDPQTDELVFAIALGEVPEARLLGLRVPRGKGIAGWVALNHKPVIVNNSALDGRFYPDIDATLEFHTDNLLAVPIIGGGQVLGVVEALNKRFGLRFTPADQDMMMLLARVAGEIFHRLERHAVGDRVDGAKETVLAEEAGRRAANGGVTGEFRLDLADG